MMYLPSLFGEDMEDMMDDFDDEFFGKRNPVFGRHAKNLMKTDIKDQKDHYELDVDLPGCKKEDISLTLSDGYLNIAAQKGLGKEEKNKEGKLIRQERYSGSMARSFYVGEGVKEEDIGAKFENGVLRITVPKKEEKKAVPEHKTIAIE